MDPLALDLVERYRRRFGLRAVDWTLPLADVPRLTGWSRQRAWQLKRDGLLSMIVLDVGDRGEIVRVNGADLVSLLRSRTGARGLAAREREERELSE